MVKHLFATKNVSIWCIVFLFGVLVASWHVFTYVQRPFHASTSKQENLLTRFDIDEVDTSPAKFYDNYGETHLNRKQTMMSPHLILIGPSKSGTSSFAERFTDYVDIEYFGQESSNTIKYCVYPDVFAQVLDLKHNKIDIDTPGQLRKWIKSQLKPLACHIGAFINKWQKKYHDSLNKKLSCSMNYLRKKGSSNTNRMPQYKDYNNNSDFYTKQMNNFNEYYNSGKVGKSEEESNVSCWLVEKFTGLVFNYEMAIVSAIYFPKLKIFAMIRNPTNRLISLMYFGKADEKYRSMITTFNNLDITRAEYVYKHEFYSNNKNITTKDGWNLVYSKDYQMNHEIDQQCLIFSQKLENIGNNYSIDNYDIIIDKNANNTDIDRNEIMLSERALVRKIFDQKTLQTNRLLAWMILWTFVYDKLFGYDNWNQFRMVQFEWFFDNVARSMGVIKCWLQLNKQVKIEKIDNNDDKKKDISTDDIFEQCPEIYFNDKKYFHQINKQLKLESKNKRAHGNYDGDPLTKHDRMNFDQVFYPCNQAFFSLLRKRRHLLLGEWIQWD